MPSVDSYSLLIANLHALRGQWRIRNVIHGALLAAALAATVLVVVVAADNLLALPSVGRYALALALWGTAAAAFSTWVLRRWLEDRRDDYFAALVEERHPELTNQLINAVQLGRGNGYGSPRLVEAIVEDAAAAVADLRMADCLDWRPVRRGGALLGAALLAVAIYALWPSLSPRFANGAARIAAPWADIPAYTATVVADDRVKPGDARVPEGAAVTVEALVAMRVEGDAPPHAAWLFRREADGEWQRAAMQPRDSAPGAFRFPLAEASGSFDYYVAAGDGRSRTFHLEVVPRPRVERLTLVVAPPAYTGQSAREVADAEGDIAALPGSTVAFELRSTKPLRSAVLRTEDEALPLLRGGDDRSWRSEFLLVPREGGANVPDAAAHPLAAPTRYQWRLSDADGYDNANPLWHSIALLRDRPPSVAVVAPGRDVQARPDDTLKLQLSAKDDYGLAEVRLFCRVNAEESVREVAEFPLETIENDFAREHDWPLAGLNLKGGDVVQYWAEAVDRNDITGPGRTLSRRFNVYVVQPEEVLAGLDAALIDYAEVLEEILRLQRENRAQTASNVAFDKLVARQDDIRGQTRGLADRMEREAHPARTMVSGLRELSVGAMADCLVLLESGREAPDARAAALRAESLPMQDRIIEELQALLARLQRNDQAREALRRIAKSDEQAHWAIATKLDAMTDDLERLLAEEQELVDRFERLPKKSVDELSEEQLQALEQLDRFQEKWNEWARGTVAELAKLPTGFVDDFGVREDVNRIFEEIEQAANRPKAEKIEVALEDLGAGLATEMLEDLEVWMPDNTDAAQWVLEEPLAQLDVPEMPLPSALEDMIGDLLQEAEEFDEEADDITSAWGDNLNQAGWGVSDGPISNFSAKGRTGNDQPNNMEVGGRAGDGRRGKSSGQMVGDTVRGLEGRPTPARVNNERYEPGQLEQEGSQDPNGATGGGKKAGAGRRGLQGGTPPDFVRDLKRLSEKQAQVRERAEQVARQLEAAGVKPSRLDRSIELMQRAEDDLRDYRYEDASRRRKAALSEIQSTLADDGGSAAVSLSRARELPAELRDELLQSADEGYPPGYEELLKSYYRGLAGDSD